MNGFLLSCSIDSPFPRIIEHPIPGFQISNEFATCVIWSSGTLANRQQLQDENLFDRNTSDADLIAKLYEVNGENVAEKMAGNCSFVLWDHKLSRLLCVRDRIGSSGFYYTLAGTQCLISNRLEPLLRQNHVTRQFNARSMVAQINGLAPAPSETFYEGIHSLNASEILIWQHGKLQTREYWKLDGRRVLRLKSDEEYAAAYRHILLQVIPEYSSHCKAVISVSAGLDSTSVAGTLRLARPNDPLEAITWIAPDVEDSDESGPAERVCQYLNLDYSQIRADIHHPMSSEDGIRTTVETPFLNFYHDTWEATFEKVRSLGAKILFTGHPGDCLFGGFVTPYSDLLLSGRITRLFDQISKHRHHTGESGAAILLRMVLRPIAGTYLPASFRRRLRKPAPWLRRKHFEAFNEAVSRNTPPARRLLPGRSRRLMVLNHPLGPHIEHLQSLHARECGIEWRSPLADHRLIEFAASLPTDQTFADGRDKMIVRRGQAGYLPDELLNQKQKILPASILRKSFEKRRDKLDELTTGMRAAEIGLVDERRVQDSVKNYLEGGDSTELFWYVLTLEDWLRRYF